MTYQRPEKQFDASAALDARVIQANQYRDNRVKNYKAGYEAFWQTPLTHGDRALSMVEMQAVLDAGQSTVQQILGDSAQEIAKIAELYPEAMTGEDPLLPARFTSSAYNYEVVEGRIVLLSLKPEWEAPSDES